MPARKRASSGKAVPAAKRVATQNIVQQQQQEKQQPDDEHERRTPDPVAEAPTAQSQAGDDAGGKQPRDASEAKQQSTSSGQRPKASGIDVIFAFDTTGTRLVQHNTSAAVTAPRGSQIATLPVRMLQ